MDGRTDTQTQRLTELRGRMLKQARLNNDAAFRWNCQFFTYFKDVISFYSIEALNSN